MHLSELWCADDYYDMAHQLLSEKVHWLTNKMPFGCKIIQIHASTYYVTNLKSFNCKFSIYEYIQNNNFMQYKWRGIKSLTNCGLTLTFFDSLRSIGVLHVICSDQSPPRYLILSVTQSTSWGPGWLNWTAERRKQTDRLSTSSSPLTKRFLSSQMLDWVKRVNQTLSLVCWGGCSECRSR